MRKPLKRNQTGKINAAASRVPACPECGAVDIARVLHGHITAARQRSIDAGTAVLANREEWEGLTEWYCKACGCDWSGRWRRFKKIGSVNATR